MIIKKMIREDVSLIDLTNYFNDYPLINGFKMIDGVVYGIIVEVSTTQE